MPGVQKLIPVLFVALLAVFLPDSSWAAASVGVAMKKPCADCHTMHDSSGGAGYAKDYTRAALSGPQAGLLNYSCAGCHNGTNNAAGLTPYVVNLSAEPPYGATGGNLTQTLAGGNFYWVAVADGGPKGHDVVGLGITQTTRFPPGGSKEFNNTDTPLTCAGTNGCHGLQIDGQVRSMWGSHHANVANNTDPAVDGIDGSTIARSFRFLDGIVGWEDPDWERTVSATDHNQYKGEVRSADDPGADTSKISALCARCHGDFHNGGAAGAGIDEGTFGSPWIRHPVDIDMGGLNGEYRGYGDPVRGDGALVFGDENYDVAVPLASVAVYPAIVSNVGPLTGANNKAIITCVTCHRAHGTKWDYSMRWDYKGWPAAGFDGCGHCHAAKN